MRLSARTALVKCRYDGTVAWNLDIGYEQFTRLCQALARDILGPSVRPLNSPRSPWDAEFDTGTAYWQSTASGEERGGLGILEVKYLQDPGRRRRESPDKTLDQWYRQVIRSDLEKIQRRAAESTDGHLPEGFIFATNVSLSDLTERTRREVSDLLAEYEAKFGGLRFEVWDREFISHSIDSLPDARYGFILGHDYILRSYESVDIGSLARYELTPLGHPPDCPEVLPAWWRLASTHDSVGGLFDTLYSVRRLGADAGGAGLPDSSQDLLRAAIVFSSAGLDACLEVLISHAVLTLVTGNDNSRGKFERYIDSQANAPKVSKEFLGALKDPDPRVRLLELYIRDLTTASFQGRASIKDRCSTALGITNEQLPDSRLSRLNDFFRSRNDVAHRLDLTKPDGLDTKPARQPRSQEEVGRMCDEVLVLVRDLIHATANNVNKCR
jgi:hypothetical protein